MLGPFSWPDCPIGMLVPCVKYVQGSGAVSEGKSSLASEQLLIIIGHHFLHFVLQV